MSVNAAYVITQAMHLFKVLDLTEQPTSTDIANNVNVLNDMLRQDQADGACQYLIKRVTAQLPAGTPGSVYSFSVGTGSTSYLVQQDAVAIRAIWVNDVSVTVNRETRMSPIADVVRTTQVGIVTKWAQERQADGSILVTAWQSPRTSTAILLEYGGRIAALTNAAGTDIVALPPEGIHATVLLLGRRIAGGYGVVLNPADPNVIEAETVHRRWRDWSHGQQWARMMRS